MTYTTPAATAASGPSTSIDRRTRRQFWAYGLSLALIVPGLVAIAVANGVDLRALDDAPVLGQLALFGGALAPTLAMLVAWAVGGRGPDWGFRRTPWRTIGIAWLFSVIAVFTAYAAGWFTGVAGFDPARLEAGTGMPPALAVIVGLVPGVLPFVALALGEQLGWSSFVTARLAAFRGPDVTAVVVGLSWAACHVPMMLFVPGAVVDGIPVAWAITMFAVQCLAFSFPMVWLRVRTRSIWPVLVLHATLNASIYFVAEFVTVPTDASEWFIGEGGVLTAAGAVLAALVTLPLWRGPRSERARVLETASAAADAA
ncbi:CPBP family intramembrane glutamic endopeptidase [Agromyces bauzanensis]